MLFNPEIFRVIVVKETYEHVSTQTSQKETLIIYYAQVLEWDIGAQGKTIEEALERVEKLIFRQQMSYDTEHGTFKIGPAAEEWQRVRNIGKEMIHVSKEYREAFGEERFPIVLRKDIDMSKTKLKYKDFRYE